MKKSRIVAIVLGIFCGVLLFHAVFAFCAVGLFFRVFYARYDTFCPTDLTVNDLHVPVEPVAFLIEFFFGNAEGFFVKFQKSGGFAFRAKEQTAPFPLGAQNLAASVPGFAVARFLMIFRFAH